MFDWINVRRYKGALVKKKYTEETSWIKKTAIITLKNIDFII